MKTIAILGGGASGLAAAVTLARELPDTTVLLYEKNAEPGRKLLATGNGRCNLSNQDIRPSDFHGDSALISLLTESFGTEDCLAFFRSLGLSTLAEERRIYPRTMAAATVRGCTVGRGTPTGSDCEMQYPRGNPYQNRNWIFN